MRTKVGVRQRLKKNRIRLEGTEGVRQVRTNNENPRYVKKDEGRCQVRADKQNNATSQVFHVQAYYSSTSYRYIYC